MFLERTIRWGGLAAILGGALAIAAAELLPSFGPPSLGAGGPTSYEVAVLSGVLWGPFVVAGLAGMWASVAAHGPGATRVLATVGLALAGAAVLVPLVVVAQAVTFGRIFFPPSPSGLAVLELWGLALASVLIGVAALGSRALGSWGLLPVIVGAAMLLGAPQAAIGLGWALLGYALWSSREKGYAARWAGPAAEDEPDRTARAGRVGG